MTRPIIHKQLRLAEFVADDIVAKVTEAVSSQIAEVLEALRKQSNANTNENPDRSITAFCRRWGISRFLFYELQKVGKAPTVMTVLGRKIISPAAEAAWVCERERDTLAAPKRTVGKPRHGNLNERN